MIGSPALAGRSLAALVGVAGALVALHLRVPVPWLIGPLAACALAARAGLPVAAPPPVWERLMRVAIGVSLGPSIAASVGAAGAGVGLVVAAALSVTVAAVALGTPWFERALGLARPSAYLAAMPGGLSMLIAMAGEVRERGLVLLAHTARVVLVVVSAALLARALGIPPEAAPLAATLEMDNGTSRWLVAALIGGFFLVAERVRLPGAHVILTMAGTALLAGLTELAVEPPEIVRTVAMLVLGITLGLEAAGGPVERYAATFRASALFTLALVGLGALVALGLGPALGVPFLTLLLALAPGGIAEVSLVALALGLDAGLVALAHACRFLLIVVAGPAGLYLFARADR